MHSYNLRSSNFIKEIGKNKNKNKKKKYLLELYVAAQYNEDEFDRDPGPSRWNNKRIFQIIRDSLYVLTYKKIKFFIECIKRKGNFVSLVLEISLDISSQKLKEILIDNYGDAATDTWMEGDISMDNHHELMIQYNSLVPLN